MSAGHAGTLAGAGSGGKAKGQAEARGCEGRMQVAPEYAEM